MTMTKPYQEYVCGFAFNPELTSVVLIEKLKPAWQEGLLNGVGGKVEKDERPIDAMTREFKEETGVETLYLDWENFLTMYGDNWRIHFYRGFFDTSGCRTVEKENVEHWPLDKGFVFVDVIPNLHWVIPLALDNIEPFAVYDNGGREDGKMSKLLQVLSREN